MAILHVEGFSISSDFVGSIGTEWDSHDKPKRTIYMKGSKDGLNADRPIGLALPIEKANEIERQWLATQTDYDGPTDTITGGIAEEMTCPQSNPGAACTIVPKHASGDDPQICHDDDPSEENDDADHS